MERVQIEHIVVAKPRRRSRLPQSQSHMYCCQDDEINTRKTIRFEQGEWVDIEWQDVEVGDIIKVRRCSNVLMVFSWLAGV